MPASQEKRLNTISKIGILAGGGDIPRQLISSCLERGLAVFVVGFEGHTDKETLEGVEHILVPLGAVGKVLKALKNAEVRDLVLIGKIRRPSLSELKPDLKAAAFFAQEAAHLAGDDGLLKALKRFLQKEGFSVHGAQQFLPDLLMPAGVLGAQEPSAEQGEDIRRGVAVLRALGAEDVGQAVVVQQGQVLGIEAAEGTDALIKRCGPLKRKGVGPVLVKLAKPGQDQDLDLPTIGPRTLENAIESGFSGLAVHVGESFVHDLDLVQEKAEQSGIFIIGIKPEDYR